MKQSTKTLFTLLPLTMVMAQALNAAPLDSYDFTANSKGATSYTAKANQEVYKQLDFNNKKDV